MNAKINEKNVKFIECPECGYDQSFFLNEDVKVKIFDWDCPKCGEHLGGIIGDDGSVELGKLPERETHFVMVEVEEGLNPFCMVFSQSEARVTAKDHDLDTAQKRKRSDTFYLEPQTPDAEHNPQGMPQYKARVF